MLAYFRRSARFGAAVMILLLTVNSCYTTIPVTATPRPGGELVLDMTTEATDRMSGFLGRGVVGIRGRLLAWERDSIVVSMVATRIARGVEQLWNGERVAIPREAIARITERRVDRGRTSLLALAGLALILTTFQAITGGNDGPSGGGTKPPPQ